MKDLINSPDFLAYEFNFDAANAKRLQWRSKTTGLDYRAMPKLALLLLQKHAGPSEKLIIKPINSVNNIISELLQLSGSGKSLMLYTDAKNFLLSTLKKGEESKYTVRAMFDLIRCDFPHLANQAIRYFAPRNLMASVYGERLIESPLEILQAANQFLELGISAGQIDDIVGSDTRFNDAKNIGKRFSVEARSEAYQKVENFYGDELDKGLRWMVQNNPGTRLNPKMGAPLT